MTARSAPAKINLYLRVTGRRPDGYHELDSLLLPLALADDVVVEVWPGRGVSCRCPGHEELGGAANLAARAAAAFLASSGVEARVEITVTKRIWVAAGLGGGSSDAAAVLLALGEALGAPPDLPDIARALGADVPFFLDPRPARARGIGERLEPVPGVPALDLVLVNPGRPLSTAAVFRALGGIPSAGWSPAPIAPDALGGLVHNDLAPAARRLCPAIAEAEAALRRAPGVLEVGLSGSGPTLFGLCPDPPTAHRAAKHIVETTGVLALPTASLAA